MESKNLVDQLAVLDELSQLESLVVDNKIEFKIDDEEYRIRKLLPIEREELRKARMKKYYELVKDPNMKSREELIAFHKEHGNDIGKIDKEMIYLKRQLEEISIKLTKSKDNLTAKKSLTETLVDLRTKFINLSNKRVDLLQYCIEEELNFFCNDYLTWLVLEKKIDDNYERVFESFDDFMKCDNEKLVNISTVYATHLIFRDTL